MTQGTKDNRDGFDTQKPGFGFRQTETTWINEALGRGLHSQQAAKIMKKTRREMVELDGLRNRVSQSELRSNSLARAFAALVWPSKCWTALWRDMTKYRAVSLLAICRTSHAARQIMDSR